MIQAGGGGAPIRVLLAISQQLLLDGIRASVSTDNGLAVVGVATSWGRFVELLETVSADVVLIDSDVLEPALYARIDVLYESHPYVKIVVLSQSADDEVIQGVLHRGASGYVLKTIEPRDLPSALRQTALGVVYHALGSAPALKAEGDAASGLTAREELVLDGIGRGLSNRGIAKELSVTEQTVKFHLTNVYRKLGVTNRLSAARYAFERGSSRNRQERAGFAEGSPAEPDSH